MHQMRGCLFVTASSNLLTPQEMCGPCVPLSFNSHAERISFAQASLSTSTAGLMLLDHNICLLAHPMDRLR